MTFIRSIVFEPARWLMFFLVWMPGACGNKLRYMVYKNIFMGCGRNIYIAQGCFFRGLSNITLGSNISFGHWCQIYASGVGTERIEIGNNTGFNSNVMINADIGGNIKIGNNVLIGPNAVLRASNHSFARRERLIREQGHSAGVIDIKDDVWIGANVVVLPNVIIGQGAIVGAGAVVSRDVDAYSIVGGVPARQIGVRGNIETTIEPQI